ncbi:hypothetical protein [Endozoicomonas sp. Mp262]|uniref:hypothetical protein n=1 Tax=Endozoicomonas sp. Mp262 TaxID=2919499 RepID=UPI0021DB4213
MKYVTTITDEAVLLTLKFAKHYGPLRCIRERAHSLLLSNRGFTSYSRMMNVDDRWY